MRKLLMDKGYKRVEEEEFDIFYKKINESQNRKIKKEVINEIVDIKKELKIDANIKIIPISLRPWR